MLQIISLELFSSFPKFIAGHDRRAAPEHTGLLLVQVLKILHVHVQSNLY